MNFLLEHISVLVVVVPLMAAPVCMFLRNGTASWAWATGVCAITFALSIVLIQHVLEKIAAPLQLSVYQSLVTALLAGIVMVPLEAPHPVDFLPVLPQLAFAGVMAVGIGYTLQLVAQRHTPAAAAAVILSLESVFAAVFGWWLLGEQLVSLALIGCALIFIAVIIAETLSESAIKRYVRAVLKR